MSVQPASLAEFFRLLNSSDRGLTAQEAQQRLLQFGPNEPSPRPRISGLKQFLLLLANPLIMMLLIASGVSAFLGEWINAAIIIAMVLIGITLNFIQTRRSQKIADQIHKEIALTATVLRDSAWVELSRRELVPGDIIRLIAGDLVPADARLVQARDLHVQQAALTGESVPIEKEANDLMTLPSSPAEAQNMVLLGTSIVSGTATALVTATGRKTAFGDIATLLAAPPPETEFERGTRKFGYLIMQTVFFLILFVLMVSAAFHRDMLEALLFAVALAVGLTPEFLPMITSVTLSQGAAHMARQKVIVKHLSAIQNFGSIDVLCSDKTGTLTRGEMTLSKQVDSLGHPSTRVFGLAYLNSFYETGIKSPLDAAILQFGKANIEGYRKIDEIPFDFERRRLSVVVEKEGERLLITKGAPEGVLPQCVSFEANGGEALFDTKAKSLSQAVYQDLSAEGYRLLAVAYRSVPEQSLYNAADEKELVLVGFVAFLDPPLEEAAGVLRSLRRDGVKVKILTGDNELVTRHICSTVGFNGTHLVLGEEIDRMSDPALAHVVQRANVFARVSPRQKNRIILAIKHRGHVVGFLGDGINDAPALHTADVGISVATAVDAAKEASDIILLERSLRVLHNGIIEGRKAFGNVMKYILMGTSSNFGNMFSMAVASLFLPFLPMLPIQILLNNFLYDLAQITIPTDNVDPTFIRKPHRWDVSLIRKFMIYIGPISSIYDFLTFGALLVLLHASEQAFHTGWFVESLATQTLVLFVIRTAGNPLRSRPSRLLTSTILTVVLVGSILPYTSLAPLLGFTPLPLAFMLFLFGLTGTYLLFVEFAKRRLMGGFLR